MLLAGVIPAAIGALAGIMAGVSSGAYWAVAAVAAIGGLLSGFEHLDGWGGADRGLGAGLIYGLALVIAHAIAGNESKVAFNGRVVLVIFTAIIGMLLAAAGGRIARGLRERAGAVPADG